MTKPHTFGIRYLVVEERGVYMDSKEHRYFGTDGFRGEANRDLTAEHAYRVGRFLGWYFARFKADDERVRIVIGKDTRASSYMLEYALASGVVSSGADAYMLHVSSTPSVSYVARKEDFDAGVMITASHNPFYDNGIKLVNKNGEKMEDELVALVEAYIDGDMQAIGVNEEDIPLAHREQIGRIIDHSAGRNRYIGYLISLASHSYKHLKIGLDAANGAVWMSAAAVFGALGAEVYTIGDEPDGININRECGATDMRALCALVKEKSLDLAFAFDGDADRCIAVDEQGEVVDGDGIMYILAKHLKGEDRLDKNTVVTTIMSNGGLHASLARLGISSVQTDVGDRFVYENMQANDYSLGGEHSGHIILRKYATTGDGLLTAIILTEVICERKKPLSALVRGLEIYPRCMKNVRVSDKDRVLADSNVKRCVADVTSELGRAGRVLLRKSGTEPKIRIMVECPDEALCKAYTELIERAVIEANK